MTDPQRLHTMALRYKQLAAETNNRQDKAALEDLAEDYARRADKVRRRHSERIHQRAACAVA
jgi:hypothetical protein